jgi:DNA polymerase-3 subunit beta
MKVSCLQENLARGLGVVNRAASRRSTLPVLSNILLATEGGRLRLSATNLEMGITCWIGAKVEDEGSTTAPAATLVDLVNTMPSDKVEMALVVRTQTLHMELREVIAQVAFAASTDDSRPVLTGVLFEIEDSKLTLAAADGFRLSVRTVGLPADGPARARAIVPARALIELGRILTDGDETVRMSLPTNRGQVVFRGKDIELVSQLIEGTFPDYQSIIPRAFNTRTVLTTAGFLKACRAADIFAREAAHSARLRITPGNELEPGRMVVSATSAETGSNEAAVDATVEGVAVEIAFNVRFLVDVLSVINSPNVALETSGPAAPGVIKPVGRDDFLHVVMPMHLGR